MSEFQNSVELKVWMLRKGIKPNEIKEALGLSSTVPITRFVNGDLVSRPIAAYLVGRGCPKELVSPKTGRISA
ncbi:MAG: hypothetical protein MI742_17995 [Desulfobacterales bacterium]|nr:hypothetical protein [Desulfobacterales bacterium]